MRLLLYIDGTLCPMGRGPDVAMRHLSIGSGAVSFRADLPEVLAELAACTSSLGRLPGRTTPICCWLRRLACQRCRACASQTPARSQLEICPYLEAAEHPALRGRSAVGLDRRRASRRRARVGDDAADSDQAALDEPAHRDHRPGRPRAAGVRAPQCRLAVADQVSASPSSIPGCATLNSPRLAGAAIVSLSVALIEAP